MLGHLLQDKEGGESSEEAFDWEEFVKDPKVKKEDEEQDDSEWMEKWLKDIKSGKGDKIDSGKDEPQESE